MRIEREWHMPNSITFSIKPIVKLLKEETDINKIGIDPFSGDLGYKFSTFTNDLNPDKFTLEHKEAQEFLEGFMPNMADYVIFDPPYSPRQLKECYDNVDTKMGSETYRISTWSKWKDQVARITKPKGKVISFGWNTNGMGKSRGFTLERILLVAHGSQHNDTIVLVEVKK